MSPAPAFPASGCFSSSHAHRSEIRFKPRPTREWRLHVGCNFLREANKFSRFGCRLTLGFRREVRIEKLYVRFTIVALFGFLITCLRACRKHNLIHARLAPT